MKQRSPLPALPALLARLLPYAPPAQIMLLDSAMRACSAAHIAAALRECNEFMTKATARRLKARLDRKARDVDTLLIKLAGESASVDLWGAVRVPSPGQPYTIKMIWGGDPQGPGGRLLTNHPDMLNGNAPFWDGSWIVPTKDAH